MTEWAASLHQSWRLYEEPSERLRVFLESDGLHRDDVLAALPYEASRSQAKASGGPDPKRYRDPRHVFEIAGLIVEREEHVTLTPLGHAVRRRISQPTLANLLLVAPYAANVLAAGQLRNPTPAGKGYPPDVQVHPFLTIWRVMLGCESRITSEELNRVVLRIPSDEHVSGAIAQIRNARATLRDYPDASLDEVLGQRVIEGKSVSDRLIPWMALASFGWLLIADKQGGEYRIRPEAEQLLVRAASVYPAHRVFGDRLQYYDYLARVSGLTRWRLA